MLIIDNKGRQDDFIMHRLPMIKALAYLNIRYLDFCLFNDKLVNRHIRNILHALYI